MLRSYAIAAILLAGIEVACEFVQAKEPENGPELGTLLRDKYGMAVYLDNDRQILSVLFNPHDTPLMELTDEDIREGIGRLSRIKSLQMLSLHYIQLDKELLDELGPLPKLLQLDLGLCQIHNKDLEAIRVFTNLWELNLTGTPISDGGLVYLKPLKKLELLRLDGTKVTGKGFKHLQHLPKLRNLYLGSTLINDESMKSLGELKTLQKLEFRRTAVTGDGILHLAGLYLLHSLVTDAKVTDKFRVEHARARAEAKRKGLVPMNHPQLSLISR